MKENAYFTVEAALVFPVVMGTIIFIICMLLFQYDRCLMEQDLGAAALWGSRLEASDAAELREKMQKRLADIYQDKYVAWEHTLMKAILQKNRFSVQGEGRLALWRSGDAWSVEAVYEYDRLSPVTFIRLCRGVGNLLQEREQEEQKAGTVS